MKRLFIYGLVGLFVILLTGCSSYKLTKNEEVENIVYNEKLPMVKTGTTTMFLGGKKRISYYTEFSYDLLTKKRNQYLTFYEDKNDVYLYNKLERKYRAITKKFELKNVKQSSIKQSKISRKNITCIRPTCTIIAKEAAKLLVIEKVFAGRIKVDYLDLSKTKNIYVQAIRNADKSVFKYGKSRYLGDFIDTKVYKDALASKTNRKDIETIELIAKRLQSYYKISGLVKNRLNELDQEDNWNVFKKEYDIASKSSLQKRKEFVKKYKNSKTKRNCYKVKVNSLNIRQKASTKSKVVGKYKNGDTVCPIKLSGIWVQSSKGWVSKKFLRVKKNYNYTKYINKINASIAREIRQDTLKSNSIKDVSNYHKRYKNDEAVKNRLVTLYRKENNLESFIKAYKLSLQKRDLLKIVSLSANPIKDLEELYLGNENYDMKTSLISLYRKDNSLDSYKKAYSLSNSAEDLMSILSFTNSKEDLEDFITRYDNVGVKKRAKVKLVKLYRKQNDFEGFYLAYKLLKEKKDAKQASTLATTSSQKAKLEELVFDNLKNKDGLFIYDISNASASYSQNESSGGFFSKYSFFGKIYASGDIKVNPNRNISFKPQFLVFNVKVNVELTVPRHKQVRSSWVGNKDTSDDVKATKTISFKIYPPYNNQKDSFSFSKTDFVYFDRGSAGGYTAKWPSNDAYLKVKSVDISVAQKDENINRTLSINFDSLDKIYSTISSNRAYIYGSGSRGVDMINRFNNVDTQRARNTRDYSNSPSSNNSSSSSSSAKSSTSSSSSTSRRGKFGSGGVKESYYGGHKSAKGHKIYIVRCKNGGRGSVFKDSDGFWKDDVGYKLGEKYRGMSLDEFARDVCGS